ncbi:glycosyltransferase, partial [Actinoplanes sp. NPDC051343]|uniref:glycosyltransferase n=1 Tax=Actinoplanes sp. NPDC051343 TaxID=3363906 RepID=UPI00378A22D2
GIPPFTLHPESFPVIVPIAGTRRATPLSNTHLGELLVPAVRGLADLDVLVVAATARDDGPEMMQQALGAVPDNVRLTGFVPFDRLLPLADVLVTNGGYGGVHVALQHGVPIVVAGASEDKPEVAARVEWTGTGVNLRTGTPKPADVREGVQKIFGSNGYRMRAQALRKEFGEYQPFDAIAAVVEAV